MTLSRHTFEIGASPGLLFLGGLGFDLWDGWGQTKSFVFSGAPASRVGGTSSNIAIQRTRLPAGR